MTERSQADVHQPSLGVNEAIVICTRNRPDELVRAIESVCQQAGNERRTLIVVDASDRPKREVNENLVTKESRIRSVYLQFEGKPSLARQRNFAIDHLAPDVHLVHFIDDDVTLAPDYLDCISQVFSDADVVAAGGRVEETSGRVVGTRRRLRPFFMLSSGKPGRVLISGATTAGQSQATGPAFEVEWLSGCASTYRRGTIEAARCDPKLEGYSLDEDLDLSYRVRRMGKLTVEPNAVAHHATSAVGRDSVRAQARDAVVHRYWFLEKNIRHPLRKPAFWWATVGRLLATMLGDDPERLELKGLVDGVKLVLRRDHYLLQALPETASD